MGDRPGDDEEIGSKKNMVDESGSMSGRKSGKKPGERDVGKEVIGIIEDLVF